MVLKHSWVSDSSALIKWISANSNWRSFANNSCVPSILVLFMPYGGVGMLLFGKIWRLLLDTWFFRSNRRLCIASKQSILLLLTCWAVYEFWCLMFLFSFLWFWLTVCIASFFSSVFFASPYYYAHEVWGVATLPKRWASFPYWCKLSRDVVQVLVV